MKVAGFVLTGGLSTRMGRDKAMLAVNGQTLCEAIADVVSLVAEKVFLVGRPERYRNLRYECLADLHPGLGPLSGVETALAAGKAELNVVVGCDVVNLDAGWLQALIQEALPGRRCVAAEDCDRKVQPLCAVYRSECGPIVSKAIAEGRLRMMDLLRELEARPVKVDAVILNANTPEDYSGMVNARRGE